jgi:hypothetical protein
VLLNVAEVRALANKLCDAIETRGQDAARIETREYWTVYFEDMFGPREPQPVVGDVADDLNDARRDLLEPDAEPVIWHAAHHLAGLLKALAYADLKGTMISASRA